MLWNYIGAIFPSFVVATAAVVAHVAGAARAETKIEGREKAETGQLIVLRATTTDKVFTWVYDKAYGFDTLQCASEKSIAFATSKPGRYIFWMVSSDGTTISAVSHVVTVGLGKPHQPPPDDPPVGDLSAISAKLATKYAALAAALNDPPTPAAIVMAWKAVSGKVRGSPDLKTAGLVVGGGMEQALAGRQGLSRYVDWFGKFRNPLNAEIDGLVKAGIIKSPEHLDAVIQIIGEAMGK